MHNRQKINRLIKTFAKLFVLGKLLLGSIALISMLASAFYFNQLAAGVSAAILGGQITALILRSSLFLVLSFLSITTTSYYLYTQLILAPLEKELHNSITRNFVSKILSMILRIPFLSSIHPYPNGLNYNYKVSHGEDKTIHISSLDYLKVLLGMSTAKQNEKIETSEYIVEKTNLGYQLLLKGSENCFIYYLNDNPYIPFNISRPLRSQLDKSNILSSLDLPGFFESDLSGRRNIRALELFSEKDFETVHSLDTINMLRLNQDLGKNLSKYRTEEKINSVSYTTSTANGSSTTTYAVDQIIARTAYCATPATLSSKYYRIYNASIAFDVYPRIGQNNTFTGFILTYPPSLPNFKYIKLKSFLERNKILVQKHFSINNTYKQMDNAIDPLCKSLKIDTQDQHLVQSKRVKGDIVSNNTPHWAAIRSFFFDINIRQPLLHDKVHEVMTEPTRLKDFLKNLEGLSKQEILIFAHSNRETLIKDFSNALESKSSNETLICEEYSRNR